MKSFFLLVSLIMFSHTFSKDGDERGNGGDYLIQDFVISAQKGLEDLKKHRAYFSFIDFDKLEKLIKVAKVTLLKKGESFPGVIRTAENYPLREEIIINQDRWSKIKLQERKNALSLHEYLGLASYEVNNYYITSQLYGFKSDEVEALPSLDELIEAFKYKKIEQDQKLEIAKSLKPNNIGYLPEKKLTKEECFEELEADLNEFFLKNVCNERGISLLMHSGVTELNLPYKFIIKTFFDVTNKYKRKVQGEYGIQYYTEVEKIKSLWYGFIDDKGKLIQTFDDYKKLVQYIAKGRVLETKKDVRDFGVTAFSSKGDAYLHTHLFDSGQKIQEYAAVILGTGLAGGVIEYSKNKWNSSTVYSTVTKENWNDFSLSLSFREKRGFKVHSKSSSNLYYKYNYLGMKTSLADNLMQLTLNGSSYKGLYRVNSRNYLIE